jgi:hypothetical protein
MINTGGLRMDIKFKVHDEVTETIWPTIADLQYSAHLDGANSFVEFGEGEKIKYSEEEIEQYFKSGTWIKI